MCLQTIFFWFFFFEKVQGKCSFLCQQLWVGGSFMAIQLDGMVPCVLIGLVALQLNLQGGCCVCEHCVRLGTGKGWPDHPVSSFIIRVVYFVLFGLSGTAFLFFFLSLVRG